MKSIVFLLTLTALIFSSIICASGQNNSDTFQIGNKQIVIPAPPGFVEAASHIKAVKVRFTATEAAENEFLASHLRNEDFQRLKAGESIDLAFYTKISVSRSLKDKTATEADFASFVQVFKKYFPAFTDPQGNVMKNNLRRASENLSAINREKTTFTFDKPYNVGEIVNDRNSFGILVLSQVKTKIGDVEESRLMLGGMSAIRVRGKVVFIYIYKEYKNEQDINDLKTFSSNWLKQIAAANK